MKFQKTVLLTGATGAIGKAIAMKIAEKGYHTILAVRNEEKAKSLVNKIRSNTGNQNIDYALVDLSLKDSIRQLSAKITIPIHVLINNAATTPNHKQESSDGVELQWAVNVLGYFRMTNSFTPHLIKSGEGRIVNVASYWAGGLNLNDPEFKHRPYNNDTAYRQSKQANRMMTYAFAEDLASNGIDVYTCHPGDVNSQLSNNLGFGGNESPDEGAHTPVWLATENKENLLSGKFYARNKVQNCQFSQNKEAISELFSLCSRYG